MKQEKKSELILIQKILSFIIPLIFFANTSYSQFFPRFSIAGGPTIGWFWNSTDDINSELNQLGIPGISKDGFLTLGGGGFVDIPVKSLRWLRLGGWGEGFTTQTQAVSQGITRTFYYHYGSGGMSFDYVKRFSNKFEMTLGAYIATGKLTIDIYQNENGFGNWNSIFGGFTGNDSTINFAHKLSVRFYSVRPQVGFGFFVLPYMYAKLNAGYQFGANNSWYADDDIPVSDAPSGIKADGFNVNFGLNFGLFTK